MPPLSLGFGAGPSGAYQTVSSPFNDGSFVVSNGGGSLDTALAGTAAVGSGILAQYLPYLLLGAIAWYVIKRRER
ncbi:hypothetical protein WS86_24505 [Burkholderia savannae]|nr:hypothetical protein WS86_24505 [Burkholderia savannae]